MDNVSNPRSSGAAVEKSALVAATGAEGHLTPGRVGGTGGNVSSAISQIVRLGDLEAIVSAVSSPITAASVSDGNQKKTTTINFDQSTLLDDVDNGTQQECSESNNGGVNAASKKPAWTKPSNVAEVTSVMGADSWPALSESTRASPKPFSPDMHKSYSDGSIYHPAQHPSPSPGSFGTDDAPNNSVKHDHFADDSSSRDNLLQNCGQRGGDFGSQLHHGNDHRPHRNSFTKGGSRFHGNTSVRNGYGGRRSNHGNHWNPNRRYHGREAHIQPHRGPPLAPLMRGPPPPPPLPFFPALQMPVQPQRGPPLAPLMPGPPPPPLPFVLALQMPGHPLGMPVVYPPDMRPSLGPPNHFAPFPLGPPIPPMLNEFTHLQLRVNVVNQVNYYFSDNNLIKDTYLRQRMDEQGWVPIQLIAGFNKVKQLTNDVQFLLDALRTSSIVEVEGEKVRRRNDWKNWLIPASFSEP